MEEFFASPTPGLIAIAIVLIPLLGFLIQIFFGKRLPRQGDFVPTGAIGLSAVLAVYLGVQMLRASDPELLYESIKSGVSWRWLDYGPVRLVAGVLLDNAGIVMLMMVTVVSFFIHVFSIGYMHGDRYYPRFFAYLSLFCFSMLGLVAADNIFFLFIFWELVGFCSYLLIGFFFYEVEPPRAGNKAFLVNKVGDVFFMLGIIIIFHVAGTFNFREIFHCVESGEWAARAGEMAFYTSWITPHGLLTLAGVLVFCGAISKSAQFPLHVWLPDAMAGPTPVSALIHAATMVAAGVFMVGRMYPFFTPEALLIIAVIGMISALITATIGIVHTDIKKVLAYSTCSQLGYMVMALGVGGFTAGLFHLITHACFKACLFLGSGSVIHAVHTQDMREMGGLRRKMPVTHATFLIATLALTGVPCLSGYFSKDAIIANALEWGMTEKGAHYLPFLIGATVAFMTMFYMMRLMYMTFWGEPKVQKKYDHAHESPPVMTIPLIALAVLAVVAAGTLLPWQTAADTWYGKLVVRPEAAAAAVTAGLPGAREAFHELHEGMHHAEHSAHYIALAVSIVMIALGFVFARLFYGKRKLSAEKAAQAIRPLYKTVVNKYYLDDFNDVVFVRGLPKACNLVKITAEAAIDFLVNFAGYFTRFASFIHGMVDKYVVDGMVNFWWWFTQLLSGMFRVLQTGNTKDYLALALLGAVIISLVMLFM